VQRRRVPLRGSKPVGTVQDCVEHFYVYGAVAPTTGESFFLELPRLNTANFQLFLQECAQLYQDTLPMVVREKGSGQKANALVLPDQVVCLFLPAYSPELNPVERLWQAMNNQVAWLLATAIDELERHVASIIRRYAKAAMQSLTSDPYVVQAVHARCS
jgi:transposase